MEDSGVTIIMRALRFAAGKHQGQVRKGREGAPYINHLIDVAGILWEEGGIRDPGVIAAALLHDTVEDTDTAPDDIETGFGPGVRAMVMEVTDDMSLPDAHRKRLQVEHASSLSPGARLVKLADKISNLRDVTDHPPTGWDRARRCAYVDWACAVIDGLRGANPALERVFDEALSRARTMLACETNTDDT